MSKSRAEISEFLLNEIQNKINDYDNFILSIGDEISEFNKREIFARLHEIRTLKNYYNTSVDMSSIPS
jgi:hypothetical protein